MLLCLFMASCNQDAPPTPRIDNPLNDANNTFAFNFLQQINTTEQDEENYMVSPLSASLALSMTYNGADGQTKTEFENTLGYEDFTKEEINTVNRNIIDALTSGNGNTTFDIANSIWYRNGFAVEQNFIDDNQTYYDAEVQDLDFGDPASVNIINNWVSDKTQGKIPDIIEAISPDAVMYLINALYFKSAWKYEFDPQANIMLGFYNENNVSLGEKEMMKQEAELEYYTHEDIFTSVQLPYKGDKFTMVLFKPQSGKITDDIIAAMSSSEWQNWKANYETEDVIVTMPKFKFEYKKQMNTDLIEMGMPTAFMEGSADFSSINPDVALFISKVLQKTFIEVNEEGSEAAAVTSVEVSTTSVGGPPIAIAFTLDQPFVFMITDKTTNSICFVGKVGNPDY